MNLIIASISLGIIMRGAWLLIWGPDPYPVAGVSAGLALGSISLSGWTQLG